ncbi:MAG: 2-phospho-L-lactate guanylyltransferase [Chloroflexi bacterium]|nr:2-phospho-L-lactate guanylyltransferase [Chloroflexota bacterium]
MRSRPIAAVIPMKPLHLAKSRLAGRLTPSERASLTLGMLGRVIKAALGAEVDEIWVVGGDHMVEEAALELGASWREDRGVDLNDALWQAFRSAFALGVTPVYLPADLPFVSLEDIGELVEASERGRKLTLSPARRDGGTNSIVVPPASGFRPDLGPDSFQRHLRQAKSLSLPVSVFESPGLGLDLDTPADLDAYEATYPGFMERLGVETIIHRRERGER